MFVLCVLLAFVGQVSATTYVGNYDEDSLQPAILSMISSILVGIDGKALIIGAAVGLVIAMSMYSAILGKISIILKKLFKLGG